MTPSTLSLRAAQVERDSLAAHWQRAGLQVAVSGFLIRYRNERTRRAYRADLEHSPGESGRGLPTLGLDKDEIRRFLAAAPSSGSRDYALTCLLTYNGLRISEALAAHVSDLGNERGHRTLTVTRKGGIRRTIPRAPPTTAALDLYLEGRTGGPLLQTQATNVHAGGRPLDRRYAQLIVHRLAVQAMLGPRGDRISPHSLRHTAITAALDAGVALRDVQDFAGHADPRTTRR